MLLPMQAFQPYKAQALESSLKIESEIDTLVQSWNEGQPLVFQVGFDTMPEVSWKSSYRELKVNRLSFHRPSWTFTQSAVYALAIIPAIA